MSDQPQQQAPSNPTALAILVAVIAAPFANEGIRRVFAQDYLLGGIAIGVALAVAGSPFYFPKAKRNTLALVAADARWWIPILGIVLAYLVWQASLVLGSASPNAGSTGPSVTSGSLGSGGGAVPDARINDMLLRLAALEQQSLPSGIIPEIVREATLSKCIGRMENASNDLPRSSDNLKTAIVAEAEIGQRRSDAAWSKWIDKVMEIEVISRNCYPNQPVDILAEPPPMQMDTKAQGEPDGLSFDSARKYRRAVAQSASAQGAVNRLKNLGAAEIVHIESGFRRTRPPLSLSTHPSL